MTLDTFISLALISYVLLTTCYFFSSLRWIKTLSEEEYNTYVEKYYIPDVRNTRGFKRIGILFYAFITNVIFFPMNLYSSIKK